MTQTPSTYFLVPSPEIELAAISETLSARGLSVVEVGGTPASTGECAVRIVRDPDLADSFRWGAEGALPEEVVRSVGSAPMAILLQVGGYLDDSSQQVVIASEAFRELGGLAIRAEGSGGASEWGPWFARMRGASLFDAVGQLIRLGEGLFASCGMHQFGLPDAQIDGVAAAEAGEWLDALCRFQLLERPVLGSGHTFQPRDGLERRTLERWPDAVHHPDDGRYNPFGVWRLQPGEAARIRAAGQTVPRIMPALLVVLRARENELGRALTETEVAETVVQSPAMVVDLADVQTLDRSRGYADIEPELAWEQWQLLRRHE